MAIQETIIVELAEVDVNDDYRVELTQLRKVMDYSPQQARDLAGELLAAADHAVKALDDDMDARRERMIAVQPRTVTGEAVL